MKMIAPLALALLAVPLVSNAGERQLLAGTTITAAFESKAAMKGHRIGGAEILTVEGDLKCKIIASTALSDDALAEGSTAGSPLGTALVGTVTPLLLICDGGKKSTQAETYILPARTLIGEQAPHEVEFIVAQPMSY